MILTFYKGPLPPPPPSSPLLAPPPPELSQNAITYANRFFIIGFLSKICSAWEKKALHYLARHTEKLKQFPKHTWTVLWPQKRYPRLFNFPTLHSGIYLKTHRWYNDNFESFRGPAQARVAQHIPFHAGKSPHGAPFPTSTTFFGYKETHVLLNTQIDR